MNGVMMTMLLLASCGVLLAVADQEHAFISGVESPFKIGETDPESSHFARFEKWAEEMEKEYECEMEKMNRYSIFKENMAYADAANEVRFNPSLSPCLDRAPDVTGMIVSSHRADSRRRDGIATSSRPGRVCAERGRGGSD